MKILFVIGNGFDLNLGMKTSYSDFYEYYKTIESPNEVVRNLKVNMSGDYKNWSDLELALGNYTEKLTTPDEFELLFEDILDNLGNYLELVESEFDIARVERASFFEHLCFPERSLLRGDQDKLIAYKDQWQSGEWYLRIITFNYTRTIEKIFGNEMNEIAIGTRSNGIRIIFKGIEHIHGYADDRMIMGVNDISQLKNASFHKNQELLEACVKTICNKAYNHTIDNLCEKNIKSADLICIFGSSIGDTDNMWWKLIGERLKDNCQLIIFTKGEEIRPRFGYKKSRIAREIRTRFLNRMELSEDERVHLQDKIYVGVNTGIFGNILTT